jgi:uncharacterized protein (DUF1778 family)
MNRPARFSPWVDMEEAEVIEEASRRTGKTPSQFVKEAGIASALAVLDVGREGQGRIQCVSKVHRKHCIDRFR